MAVQRMAQIFDGADRRIAAFMQRWGNRLLRYSLAAVFIWFGLLKPLGHSPAEPLVRATGEALVGLVGVGLLVGAFVALVGWWEVAIGLCLLVHPLIRVAIALLLLQMAGTFLPLVIMPQRCFEAMPWAPTLEGQYIVKNLVLLSAALVVGGTVRRDLGVRRHA